MNDTSNTATQQLVRFRPKRHLFIVASDPNGEKTVAQRKIVKSAIRQFVVDNVDIHEIYGPRAPKLNGVPQPISGFRERVRLRALRGFHLIIADVDRKIIARSKLPAELEEISSALGGVDGVGDPDAVNGDEEGAAPVLKMVGNTAKPKRLPGVTEVRIAMTMAAVAMVFLFLTVLLLIR